MGEKSLREMKNRVIAEELIPKREGGGMTYQTGSLYTHWFFGRAGADEQRYYAAGVLLEYSLVPYY